MNERKGWLCKRVNGEVNNSMGESESERVESAEGGYKRKIKSIEDRGEIDKELTHNIDKSFPHITLRILSSSPPLLRSLPHILTSSFRFTPLLPPSRHLPLFALLPPLLPSSPHLPSPHLPFRLTPLLPSSLHPLLFSPHPHLPFSPHSPPP